MVSYKCDKCYICKVQFADTQKCYDHSEIFSFPYNGMFYGICINYG